MSGKTYVEKVWVTEAGFKAVVLVCRGSHRCGYVGVDKNHPLYMQDYSKNLQCLIELDKETATLGDRSPLLLFAAMGREEWKSMDLVFDVHGGITFADFLESTECRFDPQVDEVGEELWYIGFDCAHAGDGKITQLDDEGNIIHDPYSFSYPGDVVRTLEFVQDHCERLAEQIKDKTILPSMLENKE